MLLEVLVAIVVAGLVFGAVGRALADGWRNARIPLDIVAAVTIARTDLWHDSAGASAALPGGYTMVRRLEAVDLLPRPASIAPAPHVTSAGRHGPAANDVMPGVTHHPDPTATGRLESTIVTVRSRSGRQLSLAAVRLDVSPN